MEPLVVLLALALGLLAGYLWAYWRHRRTWEVLPELIDRALKGEGVDLPQHLYVILGDVRRRMLGLEGQVRTIQTQLTAMLDAIDEAVVWVDADARLKYGNLRASDLLGADRVKPGKSLVDLFRDPAVVGCVKEAMEGSLSEAREFEMGMPKRTMAVRVVRAQGIEGAILTIRDLSEMRRLEKSRQELISNISHELRTPIANIRALVETLSDGAIDDSTVAKEFLRRVEVEVDGLSQLVRELLELSLIESGQAPLELRDLDVVVLVEEVVARLAAQARRAGVSLETDVKDVLPLLRADRQRLEQVLVNLVHNAIKFTPSGGRITVGGALEGSAVHLWVADTGIGIAPEDLPRIFERLYKADRSRSSSGTGLGLAIAKHIVKAHGGEIWAESELGKGSVFHIRLPVGKEVGHAQGEL